MGNNFFFGPPSGANSTPANGTVTIAILDSTTTTSSAFIENLTLTATVAANALTITLKDKGGATPSASSPVTVGFRNATSATGTYTQGQATAATSVVVPSGATLGQIAAVAGYIYVYLINNSGTLELAVSGVCGNLDEGSTTTTTTIDTAADSKYAIYSTTGRSNVPLRLVGRILITEATPGTYATAPSEISLVPFRPTGPRSAIRLSAGNGYGSSSTFIRRYTTTDYSFGTAISYADSASVGGAFTITKEGMYSVVRMDFRSSASSNIGISRNADSGQTTIGNLGSSMRLAETFSVSNVQGCLTWVGYLDNGDVIRAQDNGSNSSTTSVTSTFEITYLGF